MERPGQIASGVVDDVTAGGDETGQAASANTIALYLAKRS